jgi:hypothetical protein
MSDKSNLEEAFERFLHESESRADFTQRQQFWAAWKAGAEWALDSHAVTADSTKPNPGDCAAYPNIGQNGLTKRELFAAMVMQNLATWPIQKGDPELVAARAVEFADALLKELARDR